MSIKDKVDQYTPVLYVVRNLYCAGLPSGDAIAHCLSREIAEEIASLEKGEIVISEMYANTPHGPGDPMYFRTTPHHQS